ncbi:MAG: Hsp20/alpha crystallin family protein [Desulfobacterales bacterium]|nr:Hsp20/alpha crystallin family protein [Desulfobacterales bacterium]MDD4071714.1 Hsp20/alpha crystallin family protein [Desulfobacterales bacterium]MDD4391382.1 Hsp20/alpha crystallin family protein [Desulfobacterales bacterium]
MALLKWDPFNRTVTTLQDRINQAFDESFGSRRAMEDEMSICAWKPAVDIYETDESYVLKAEIPGVSKEDVVVELKDNILTLSGERLADKKIEEERYYRKERCFGTFYRAFTLRDRVSPEKIKAKTKDGILEIEIPKVAEEKPKSIKVSVE